MTVGQPACQHPIRSHPFYNHLLSFDNLLGLRVQMQDLRDFWGEYFISQVCFSFKMTSPQGNIFQIIWPPCYESFLRNIKREALCTSNKMCSEFRDERKKTTPCRLISLRRSWCGKVTGSVRNSVITKTISFCIKLYVMKVHGYRLLLKRWFLYLRLEHRDDLVEVMWKFIPNNRAVKWARIFISKFPPICYYYMDKCHWGSCMGTSLA